MIGSEGDLLGFDMARSKMPVPCVNASPPCFAHELAETKGGMDVIDPQQALDVARWRSAKRKELLAQRAALSVSAREALGRTLASQVINTIHNTYQRLDGKVLSLYWPIKSEPDLRQDLASLLSLGMRLALPVVETKNTPLSFYA